MTTLLTIKDLNLGEEKIKRLPVSWIGRWKVYWSVMIFTRKIQLLIC